MQPTRSSLTLATAGLIGLNLAAFAGATPVVPARTHLATESRAIELTAGDHPDIVIDLVRHGETQPPGSEVEVASSNLPGFPLSEEGQQQAQQTADNLVHALGTHVSGVFGGDEQRMIETAQPFLDATGESFHNMSGFDEIQGGIFADTPPDSPGGLLSEVLGFLWVFGAALLPLPGTTDTNGVVFDELFGNAVGSAYADALANPVESANDHVTDVVYSGEGAILAWTLLNVKNPDLEILLPLAFKAITTGDLLPTASITEIDGNPVDGWTLDSFGGVPIPKDPGFITEAFVYLRNLLLAPEMAGWNLFQAALTGKSDIIDTAFKQGMENIDNAIEGKALIPYFPNPYFSAANGDTADAAGNPLSATGTPDGGAAVDAGDTDTVDVGDPSDTAGAVL